MRRGTMMSASLLALAWSIPLTAQTSPPDGRSSASDSSTEQRATPAVQDDADGLQDIVVTARRQSENIQSVPVAVTAYSQEDLRQRGVQSATDLQNFTPSLSVIGNTSRNQETYTIRGIGGSGSLGTGGGPGVVGYFAEVPTNASGPGLMFDLRSIQVLKGPQGTLFGRNTTGGAVLFDPARPTFDNFGGYAEMTLGNYDRMSGNAAVNIPILDDVLAIRVAGQFDSRSGNTYDVNTNRDYNDRNNYSGRVGILFRPSDSFTNYTAVNFVGVNEHGPGNVLLAVNPTTRVVAGNPNSPVRPNPLALLLNPLLATQRARGVRRIALSTVTKDVRKDMLVLNSTEWKIAEGFSLKNIFSYARTRANAASDGDASALVINDLRGAPGDNFNANTRTITEELQARFTSGPATLQVGGFYSNNKSAGPSLFVSQNLGGVALTPAGPVIIPITLFQDSANVDDESKAVFANLGWKVTDTLTATLGGRYTWDKFAGDISIRIPELANQCATNPGFFSPRCSRAFDGKSDGPSWHAGLDWQAAPDTFAYVVSRRGYKSGGINPSVLLVSANSPFFRVRPETVTDVEVGVKREWDLSGVKARTNVAAFYSRYEDIQRSDYALIGGFNTQVITNAAQATIKGVEFEGVLIPFDALTLTGTYSYNDATYDRYIDPAGFDRSGFPFQYVPKHKFSIDGQLRLMPRGSRVGDVALRASYGWQSRQQVASDVQPFDTIPSYGLLNLRLDWSRIDGGPLDAALFVTNVTDKTYRVTSNATYFTTGLVGSVFGDPRQYGASLRMRF